MRQILVRFRRSPGFTLIALITLAIGIGATTAVFSVVDGVLLAPLPYPHPQQLVQLRLALPGVSAQPFGLGPSNYFVYLHQNHSFQSLGLYDGDMVAIRENGRAREINALDVTFETLQALEVKPELGRLFNAHDDQPSATRTVVLTDAFWRQHFGGSRSVIGQTLVTDGKPREIIGVLPPGFRFLNQQKLGVLVPERYDRSKIYLGNFGHGCLARLKPGVTLAEARADEARMWPIVLRSFPPPPGYSLALFQHARALPSVRPLRQVVVGEVGPVLWIILGGMALVLLIACANVANLMLVRAEGRQQELAIRAALGCGRGRLAAELLGDSIVLGLLGGALGLGLAYAGLRLLVWLAPGGLPRLANIGLHPWVLLVCFLAALFAGVIAGVLPALQYSRVSGAMREGGRSLSSSRQRHRARNGLVLAQVALAFVLLICAGLMIRTFAAMRQVNPGFQRPDTLQTFGFYIPKADLTGDLAVVQAQAAMVRQLAALPGVSAAAAATQLPLGGYNDEDPIFAADHHYATGQVPPLRGFTFVSPGYFHAMGIPLLAGRDFTWEDNFGERPVAIISAAFAREDWGSPAAALGHRIRPDSLDTWRQIVGVVGNVRAIGLAGPEPSATYWPLLMSHFEGQKVNTQRMVRFVLRTPRAGTSSLMAEVRDAAASVDANAPVMMAHTMGYYYDQSLARTSFTLVMLGIAGIMALLLGAIGLYGVLAYAVSQRRREIGIRLALGQEPRAVVGMIVRQGLTLAAAGVGIGIVLALGAGRLLTSLLFGVRSVDGMTYAAVIVALGLTAALASLLPARRAAQVDPAEALRAE